jgi:mono/diheme cytochrome c family protein
MRSWRIFAFAALLVTIFVVGGWLIGRRPASLTTGVAQTATLGDLQVTVQLDQAALGERVVEVSVQDAAGKPVDVSAVQLRFSMAEMDMGTIVADAQPVSQGQFQARGQFFTMVGRWLVDATLARSGQPSQSISFAFPIAAPGEAAGPINPLPSNPQTILAGQELYQVNCITCHGPSGKGDGPAAAGLNPRPADFSQHMPPGKHTDGQIYLWIKDGYPNSAMPAFGQRFSEEQLWQLVTFLRTFGWSAPQVQAAPSTQAPAQPLPAQPAPSAAVPNVQEPLPPLVFARLGNIWRSLGDGAAPQQLTSVSADSYAKEPVFSPDGSQVAFIVTTQPTVTAKLPIPTGALYVMNADGSDLRAVWKPDQGLLGMPAWTPDGQKLYVAVNGLGAEGDTGRQLHVVQVDLATGAQQPILEDALDPTISRDGTQLAYLSLSQDGYTMSLEVGAPDGSGGRQVLGGGTFQGFYAPRFSPDGTQIVVAAIGGPQTDQEGKPIGAAAPAPLQALFSLFEPPTAAAHGLPWDLWIVNTDGTGLRRLTTIYEDLPMASFSPDGKQIAVMGVGGIYLMDADGARLRRIDQVGDHGGLDWAR